MLIMLTEADVIPPVPFWVAKITVANCPLPENALVLMMPILMEPGLLVLEAINASEARLPWLTVGEEREVLS